MNWLKNYAIKMFLGTKLSKIWAYLEGKKTITGSISLLLTIGIWIIPIAFPQWEIVGVIARQIAEFLQSNGVDMQEALSASSGLTVIGLLDKLRQLAKARRLELEELRQIVKAQGLKVETDN